MEIVSGCGCGYASAFSRRDAPELCMVTCPLHDERAQGRPGARCTRGPVCNGTKKCAHEHTGPAESIRPSLRNGLTAYGALSPETNSSCLRRCRIDGPTNPVGFDWPPPAWHQPRVPEPHAFAVRNNAARPARINRSQPQDKAQGHPAMPRARNAIASTAPRTPRIVTTRTPLFDEAGCA